MSLAVYFGLGGNVGNVREAFGTAIDLLAFSIGPVSQISSLYRTFPLNPPELAERSQPIYLNCCAQCISKLPSMEILSRVMQIEELLGRDRHLEQRWGPRKIDIDILIIGEERINQPDLIIPHPELHNRDFVLVPLAEIAPKLIHPSFNVTVTELLESLPRRSPSKLVIESISWANLPAAYRHLDAAVSLEEFSR